MKISKDSCQLLCAITVLAINVAVLEAAEPPGIQWNEAAQSQVLNKNELLKVGPAFPSWNIKQITWPSMAEINAKCVTVDERLKASCMGWLQKFIKKEQLPIGLEKNLVAVKNWGLIRKEAEQKRLCDVFIARFKKASHVIHIQESAYNVVIGFADERIPMNVRADHKDFVIETATLILNES